ncbi:hypothetical protein P3G22_14465, partial [Rhodopseudomonas sp. BAL398]|nr:hypothetical protein [Rhodopseudomonas sp. BAL398]
MPAITIRNCLAQANRYQRRVAMVGSAQQGFNSTFMPFGAAPASTPGVAPQGIDFNAILKQIAGQAAQALPGLIMGLLSSHPTLGPQMRAQGVSPQSLFNIGINTPFGGGGLDLFDAAPEPDFTAQGFNFRKLLKDVSNQALKTLPGLIMGLLSANPTIGPQLRAQGVSPQSLINFGINTPFGGGGIS